MDPGHRGGWAQGGGNPHGDQQNQPGPRPGAFGPGQLPQQSQQSPPAGHANLPPPNGHFGYQQQSHGLGGLPGLAHSSPRQPPQPAHRPDGQPGIGFSLPAIGQATSQAAAAEQRERERARDIEQIHIKEEQDRAHREHQERQRLEQAPQHQAQPGQSIHLHQPVAVGPRHGLLGNPGLGVSQAQPGFPLGAPSGPGNIFAGGPVQPPQSQVLGNQQQQPGLLMPFAPAQQQQAGQQQQQGPPPAGQTQGQGQGQQPILNDALSYLDQVKVQFADHPDVYNRFLDIMKDFKSGAIDTPGVIGRVSQLFAGNPELIQGFNTFLPPGYRIECGTGDDPNAIRVTTPMGTTVQSMPQPRPLSQQDSAPGRRENGTYTPQPGQQPQMMLSPNGRAIGPMLGSNHLSPLEVARQQEQQAMHQQQERGVNHLQNAVSAAASGAALRAGMSPAPGRITPLPQDGDGPVGMEKRGPVEFNHAISYVNKIKNRFSSQPDIYKQFLEILQTYQRESKPIQDVYSQVTHLFKTAPDLLDDFKQFLPESAAAAKAHAARVQAEQQAMLSHVRGEPMYGSPVMSREVMGTPNHGRGLPPVGNFAPTPTVKDNKRKRGERQGTVNSGVEPMAVAGPSKGAFGGQQSKRAKQAHAMAKAAEQPPSSPTLIPALPFPLPPTTSTLATSEELSFFDRAKKAIANKNTFNEFLKLCNLFSQDLIDRTTLIHKSRAFVGSNTDLMKWFMDFVGYEEKDILVENKPRIPGGRVSLSNCRGLGPSYRLLPKRMVSTRKKVVQDGEQLAALPNPTTPNAKKTQAPTPPATLTPAGKSGSKGKKRKAPPPAIPIPSATEVAAMISTGLSSATLILTPNTKAECLENERTNKRKRVPQSGMSVIKLSPRLPSGASTPIHTIADFQDYAGAKINPAKRLKLRGEDSPTAIVKTTFEVRDRVKELGYSPLRTGRDYPEAMYSDIRGSSPRQAPFDDFFTKPTAPDPGPRPTSPGHSPLGRSFMKLTNAQILQERQKPCSGRDELCQAVLNDEWASHPTWASEDSGFVAHRKNAHEEGLHRIEEERHDYDYNIEACGRTVQLLEPLAQQLLRLSPIEQMAWQLPTGLGGQSETIYKRVIMKVYGREMGHEVIRELHNHPYQVIPVLLNRLKERLESWKLAQREWEKVWREQTQKMFWKSLDHQAVNTRNSDKKAFQMKTLLGEIQVKHEEMVREDKQVPGVMHNAQFSYAVEDADVVLDVARLVLTYIDANMTQESPKLPAWMRDFIPTFFGMDPDSFNEKVAIKISPSDTPANELADDLPSGAEDAATPRGRKAKGNNLFRNVIDKQRAGKFGRKDREDSNASASRASTPEIGSIAADDMVIDTAEEAEKSEAVVQRWLEHPTTGNSVGDRNVDPSELHNRTVYTMWANGPTYCFVRMLTMLYERLLKLKKGERECHKAIARANTEKPALDLGIVDKLPADFFEDTSEHASYYRQMLGKFEKCLIGDADFTEVEDILRRFYLQSGYQLYSLEKMMQAFVRYGNNILINEGKEKSLDIYNIWRKDRMRETSNAAQIVDYRKSVEKLLKDSELYRIDYDQANPTLRFYLTKKDDPTFDAALSPADQEHRWRYYLASYTAFTATAGITYDTLTRPFLSRNYRASGLATSDLSAPPSPSSEEGVDYILRRFAAARSEENLTIRITVNSYHRIFEKGTQECFFLSMGERSGAEEGSRERQEVKAWREEAVREGWELNNEAMRDVGREVVEGANDAFMKLVAGEEVVGEGEGMEVD
nr:hypothetical protein B0A51_09602 [Rachicladosporium sp. CCFEE 5018]